MPSRDESDADLVYVQALGEHLDRTELTPQDREAGALMQMLTGGPFDGYRVPILDIGDEITLPVTPEGDLRALYVLVRSPADCSLAGVYVGIFDADDPCVAIEAETEAPAEWEH